MKEKNNIWIINHYADPPNVGKTTRSYNFAKILIERGYDVKIFAASTVHGTNYNMIKDNKLYKEEIIGGVPYVFIRASNYIGNSKSRVKNMFEYTLRLLFAVKMHPSPKLILASSPHPLNWLSGYVLSKRYKAKFVAETRDLWPETLVTMGQIKRNSIVARILYALERFTYKRADRLIFTFPGGKDYVKEIGLDNSKVRYINNGIDLKEFNFNNENYINEDADLENKGTFKVLYTGAMGRANALMHLVEAAKAIKEKGIGEIKLILFGDGYQKEELKKYVKSNGLDNVLFKEKVEKKYIPSILSKSNLNIILGQHINLYRFGLSPNKLFDYFASGKPTLSNVECGYDIIEEYNCGLTVKGGSAEALAEGILRFYNMSKEEDDMYCQNALIAAKDFDFKILTDKLEQIILELLPKEEPHANTVS